MLSRASLRVDAGMMLSGAEDETDMGCVRTLFDAE
jgi:hypothetical protein